MRIGLSLLLIFSGIVLLATGVGAFAGIPLIILGVVVWVWGVGGAQTDESITEINEPKRQEGIVDPNEPEGHI